MINYKKALLPVIASILIFSFIPNSVIAEFDDEFDYPYVSDQVIVSFKPGISQEDIEDFYENFYEDYDLIEQEDFDSDDKDDDPEERLVHTPLDVSSTLIRIIEQDPRVEYAELNYVITADLTPNELQFDQLWGLHNTGQTGGSNNADIDAPQAWDTTTNSSNIIVGIIDTGVNYNHEDLTSNIWTNPNEISGNGIDDDANGFVDDVHGINAITDSGDPMDDNGHGTHVAGTIGAQGNNGIGIVGVNWNTNIAACKFLDSTGSGTTANAIKCFKYFNSLKNVHGQNIVITSNSWGGGGFSQALKDAMAGLDQLGMSSILHVAAAGNSNSDNDISPHYPSSYDLDNIISVAATDHNDLVATFSNYGLRSVDLSAPGVSILSTVLNNLYDFKSGTSMATPHVSGVAALIWSTDPGLSAVQVKQRIISNVDNIGNLGNNSLKPTLTDGRVNLLNAISTVNDLIAPTPVTDLAILSSGQTSITLNWTATGDDGNIGTASFYDVRYSTSSITDASWSTASQAIGEPSPQLSGASEIFTVSGLLPNTTYQFALKVSDNAGNESGLSNVVTANTTAGDSTIFFDDMENGQGLWTTFGVPGLWHQTSLRSTSPTTSWYYGIDTQRNYETGTSANSGTLVSPIIDLSRATDALLSFNELSELESFTNVDRTRVQVSVNGTGWTTIFESHGTLNAFDEPVWMTRTVDLTPYVGETINIRFWFDTVDQLINTFEGWYVDDVKVIGTMGPANQPPVAIAGSDQTGMEGDSFTFNGNASFDPDGTIVSYEWDFGDGTFGSGITPTHVYLDNANYTATLTVTDNRGGINADTSIVSVSNVVPTANVGGPYSGLAGFPITFSANAVDPGSDVLTYEWDFDYDGTFTTDSSGVDLVNPSHAYTLEGNKTIALQIRDDDGGISPPSTTQVIVTQPHPPLVDSVSSSSSNDGTQFSWTHDTGATTNRLLIVGTSVGDNPATVLSINYGGQPLTQLQSDMNANPNTATELWYLINPPSGLNTISVTMTDKKSVIAGAITFSGVNQTSPFSFHTGNIGSGVSPEVVIPSSPNEMVVDVMALFKSSGTSLPELDQTQRWNLVAKDVEGGSSTKVGDAFVTMSWTTDNTDWAISAASIIGVPSEPPKSNNPPVLKLPIITNPIKELEPFTFTANATDTDNDPVTFGLSGEPAGATINQATGVFTWTPTEAQGPGIFTFSITVSDGIIPVSETISITVEEKNSPPVSDNQSVTTTVGTPVAITLSAIDEDIPIQGLTFSIVTNPTSGTLSGVAPNLTYTPNPNFDGLDGFTFTVSDGEFTSDNATVSITVSIQATDVVEITRAEYNSRNEQLRIEATSTDPSADLSVLGIPLNNNLDGTYQLRTVLDQDPGNSITVTSSLGGTDTSLLNHK